MVTIQFFLLQIRQHLLKIIKLKKWLFDKATMDGLLDIKLAIRSIDDIIYRNVFNVALASILLQVSNVYRNGKCVSYKKNWKERHVSRKEVQEIFLSKLENIIACRY